MSIPTPPPPAAVPAAARPAPSDRAVTVADLAARWAVKQHQILLLIRAGELRALNVAAPGAARPRWRILADDLAAFEARRAAVPIQRPAPRRKQEQERGLELVDPATGRVNRAFAAMGSVKAAMAGAQ